MSLEIDDQLQTELQGSLNFNSRFYNLPLESHLPILTFARRLGILSFFFVSVQQLTNWGESLFSPILVHVLLPVKSQVLNR